MSIHNTSYDADLLTRVGIALTLRLQHTLHAVHLHVSGGTVTLRGIVPSFYDRQLAIEVTRRVAGVLKVQDELFVGDWKSASQERRANHARRQEPANASNGAGAEPRRPSVPLIRDNRPQPGWRAWFANPAAVLRGFLASLLALGSI